MSSVGSFRQGLGYWWHGWGLLLRSRALGFYAVLPFLMAMVFSFSVLFLAYGHLSNWTDRFLHFFFSPNNAWIGILHYPIWIILLLMVFFWIFFLTYLVHVVLCGPFYSLLAERALRDLGKSEYGRLGLSVRVLWASLLKAALFLMIGLALFVFSFVPMMGVLGLLVALMILAFDTMDYSFEAMGMGFGARFRYFGHHMPQWLGMAASLALTLMIPGLTFLILPGAVVGAAMIFDKGDARGARASS